MVDVSVLVTCYNKEQYLDEAITSILRQTKLPKEIIIVHDGCDEAMAHSKAISIFLPKNLGVAKARAHAFKHSTGKLVLFFDGDDVLDPDYLEKMILIIAKKKADIAYPDLYLWMPEPRVTILPNNINPAFVKDKNKVVIPVTCLMKREVYELLGGFREFKVLEDLDFWMRAMCNGYIFKKAETLLWYRRTGDTRNAADINLRKETLKEIMSQFKITKQSVTYADES